MIPHHDWLELAITIDREIEIFLDEHWEAERGQEMDKQWLVWLCSQ